VAPQHPGILLVSWNYALIALDVFAPQHYDFNVVTSHFVP
jgi:hypothetical protein